jgi:hypothetical protein
MAYFVALMFSLFKKHVTAAKMDWYVLICTIIFSHDLLLFVIVPS